MSSSTAASTSAQPDRGARKIREGVVVSAKMRDTIVVRIDRLVRHPFYPRVIRRSERYKVHDAGNTARAGDVVSIMETRPLSKDKRWRLVEIVRRGSPMDEPAPAASPEAAA